MFRLKFAKLLGMKRLIRVPSLDSRNKLNYLIIYQHAIVVICAGIIRF